MRRAVKAVERAGRRALLRLLTWVAGVRPSPVAMPRHRPARLLVVRLDERMGNLLLTTPLMLSLARRYPGCQLDLVCHAPNAALLRDLPFVGEVLGFAKWRLLGFASAWSLVRTLRKRRYDAVFDAANPSQPSLTQALLVRVSGAGARVGYDRLGFGSLYTAPVTLPDDFADHEHEIDLRLRLLTPLGAGPLMRQMAVAPPWPPQNPRVVSFLAAMDTLPYVAVNLGARLARKRLRAADYAMVANVCTALGFKPLLVWGPRERHLLAPVQRLATDAVAAPATDLRDLACLLRGARAVVSADSGPMHLAVALGRPTCGLFVTTSPGRYGHARAPHLALDLNQLDQTELLAAVRQFLAARRTTHGTAQASAAAKELLGRPQVPRHGSWSPPAGEAGPFLH